jgi:hypothetical protein
LKGEKDTMNYWKTLGDYKLFFAAHQALQHERIHIFNQCLNELVSRYPEVEIGYILNSIALMNELDFDD